MKEEPAKMDTNCDATPKAAEAGGLQDAASAPASSPAEEPPRTPLVNPELRTVQAHVVVMSRIGLTVLTSVT